MRSDRRAIYDLLAAGRINSRQAEQLLWASSSDGLFVAVLALALILALATPFGSGSLPSALHAMLAGAGSTLRHAAAAVAHTLGEVL